VADVRRLAQLPDAAFEEALRDLGRSLAVPAVPASAAGLSAGTTAIDPARRARLRIEAAGFGPARRGLADRLGLGWPTSARPMRRGLVLAIAAILVLAAVAGAIGFGLPGLRIVFGPGPTPTPVLSPSIGAASPSSSPAASPTPTPTAGPPGSTLGLGRQVTLAEATAQAPFPVAVPSDPTLGPPDTVWIDGVGRVTLVWAAKPGLPSTNEPGIGLIVTELPGRIEPDYFQKLLNAQTTIEDVDVGGAAGYWISGDPHQFIYVDASGQPVFETRRLVGDTLAWSVGPVTYRLESALGRDESIRLAETIG